VPFVLRCGTRCGIEHVKDRTKSLAGVRFCCKSATFKSALGRTRTCGLLIRRPNRAVLCGSLGCALALLKHLRCPAELACSRHAPVNSTGVISVTLGRGTRTRQLARNRPQLPCASLRSLPPGPSALVRRAQFFQRNDARLGQLLTVRPHPHHLRAAEHL
jgi:hypothetical protein